MPTARAGDSPTGAAASVDTDDSSAPSQLSDGTSDNPAQSSGQTVVILDPPMLQLARRAAEGEAGRPEHIGEFQVALAEDEIAITAQFAAAQPGYLGWHWSVTLAVVSEEHPTVSEVVLLPGDGALLAPAWIPWDQRIRPGDVGIGDLLPLIADDPRVVPAYLQSDDPAVEAVALELGLGRAKVLSREGRIDFAERLHDGTFGAENEVALAAPAHCVTCAFYLPLAGSLGQLLGGCGNEYSPADGRVVDAGYGCGAHSETEIVMPARSAASDVVIDEVSLEVHRRPAPAGPPEPDSAGLPGQDGADQDGSVLDAAVLDNSVLDNSVLDNSVLDNSVLDLESLEAIDVDALDPDLLGADLAREELAQAALLDTDVSGVPDGVLPDAVQPEGMTPVDLMPDQQATVGGPDSVVGD